MLPLFKRASIRDEILRDLKTWGGRAHGSFNYLIKISRVNTLYLDLDRTPDIYNRMSRLETPGVEYSDDYTDHLKAWITLEIRLFEIEQGGARPKVRELKETWGVKYNELVQNILAYKKALARLRELEDAEWKAKGEADGDKGVSKGNA